MTGSRAGDAELGPAPRRRERSAHPDVVLRALQDVPKPVVPSAARDAYDQVVAGFERRLDETALEAFAPDPGHVPEERGVVLGPATFTPLSLYVARLAAFVAADAASLRETVPSSGTQVRG